MRTFFATALLGLVVFAAGCGGGGGGGSTPTTTGGTTSGEASKPAAQVLRDAVQAANGASSMHMSGQVSSSGQTIGLDLAIANGKGVNGSMTFGGAKVDIVVAGKEGYLRGSSKFWNQFSQASGLAQLLSDKWLKFPTSNAQFGSLTDMASAKGLFQQLESSHGKLVNKGLTTYHGQSVVAIYNSTEKGTLYVAATGTPYPVALVGTGSLGTVTFDKWNEPVTVTAPSGALDFSQLGSGG